MESWARKCPIILPTFRSPRKFRDLPHAENLRRGTERFTSPLKEGVQRIFSLKFRRIRPGLNPRAWILKACTLPLDHLLYLLIYFRLLVIFYFHFVDRFESWWVQNFFLRYDTVHLSALLDAMVSVQYCSRPLCQYQLTLEPGEKMAMCPSCDYEFCMYCKMVYH